MYTQAGWCTMQCTLYITCRVLNDVHLGLENMLNSGQWADEFPFLVDLGGVLQAKEIWKD